MDETTYEFDIIKKNATGLSDHDLSVNYNFKWKDCKILQLN